MTTLSHSNFWLHHMLTDQGAFIHEHCPETFEDVGDPENGPELSGGPAFDRYSGESHEFIIDPSGTIVATIEIDWDHHRWCEEMAALHGSDEHWGTLWPEYKRKRHTGEDWIVRMSDEDGIWYSQDGRCWTDDRNAAHYFTKTRAEQIALAANTEPHDRIVGPAVIKWVERL